MGAVTGLTNIEIEQRISLERSGKPVAGLDRPYADRRPGVDQIAHFQCDEARYVGDDAVDGE